MNAEFRRPAVEEQAHKLGCDEQHQHQAPKCCDASCWCQQPPTPDRGKWDQHMREHGKGEYEYNGIYVASRASIPERPAMWRKFRREGWPIVSTWIDEAGEGETENFADLWLRISREIAVSGKLVFYAESGDFPLKGALIEIGIALGLGKPICAVLPGVQMEARSYRPVGPWITHPSIRIFDTVEDALADSHRAAAPSKPGAEEYAAPDRGIMKESDKVSQIAAVLDEHTTWQSIGGKPHKVAGGDSAVSGKEGALNSTECVTGAGITHQQQDLPAVFESAEEVDEFLEAIRPIVDIGITAAELESLAEQQKSFEGFEGGGIGTEDSERLDFYRRNWPRLIRILQKLVRA